MLLTKRLAVHVAEMLRHPRGPLVAVGPVRRSFWNDTLRCMLESTGAEYVAWPAAIDGCVAAITDLPLEGLPATLSAGDIVEALAETKPDGDLEASAGWITAASRMAEMLDYVPTS
jgi:hypothetical protein